jgi:protein-S-isoprenylcysteine O-methyltransferase Ste14
MSGFNNNYAYFAVADQARQGIHYAAVCPGSLWIRASDYVDESCNGKIPKMLLLLAAFLFLIAFIATGKTAQRDATLATAVNKYASRLFLIAVCYLALKSLDNWLTQTLLRPDGGIYSALAATYREYKRSNFSYFYHFFIDAYFIANLVLVLPFLYFFDSHRTAENDKYSNLVRSVVSIADLLRGRRPFWSKTARLGMLTLFVKFFYIPLLVTWVINNTLHQFHLTNTFQWELSTVNSYLVALFIYIDTAIFCFGYLFEFSFLKNTIRTVEPTVLGWLVCLWCYPPFNLFSFRLFDHEIIRLAHPYPSWVHAIMLCMITALWGIFAWASLSLGWKASNLTNRGIVRHGPYKHVRHPAYTAKLFVWYIQGIFFGQYFLGILLGFTLIYMLRAWTEERHLSLDPDYMEYRKAVKWKFIPGLI